MLAEAEAKTRWCPFARVPFSAGPDEHGVHRLVAVNRGHRNQMDEGPDGQFGVGCIASACMAWRWKGARFLASDGTYSNHFVDSNDEAFDAGYCGLAGRP